MATGIDPVSHIWPVKTGMWLRGGGVRGFVFVVFWAGVIYTKKRLKKIKYMIVLEIEIACKCTFSIDLIEDNYLLLLLTTKGV